MSLWSFSLLLLLTFTQIAYSQSGEHKPSGPVTHVREQHDDKKQVMDVYETLDNLGQELTVITKPVTCSGLLTLN